MKQSRQPGALLKQRTLGLVQRGLRCDQLVVFLFKLLLLLKQRVVGLFLCLLEVFLKVVDVVLQLCLFLTKLCV
mgnify:FL=1